MLLRRRLTNLETALYALIVAVLAGVLLDSLVDHAELAERAYVELTLTRIQEGVNIRQAQALLTGKAPDPALWASGNPFALAGMTPVNFRGEYERPEASLLDRGEWLFDRGRAELVYRPRLARYLETPDPDGVLRFRLAGQGVSGGVGLHPVPVRPYKWDIE